MVIYEQLFKKNGLSPTQQKIIEIIGEDKTILEIGSSAGYMTKIFLENGCKVDVVESDSEVISKIPKGTRKILNKSIEEALIYKELNNYDFIIMADVLEHLVNPEQVLKKLLKIASDKTRLIISVPNIASWAMRKQLFFNGDFEYRESGLLDKTHLHFYTVNTLPKILSKNGWKVKKIIGTVTRLPLEGIFNKIPLFGLLIKNYIYKRLNEKYKNLSYYHFLVIACKK